MPRFRDTLPTRRLCVDKRSLFIHICIANPMTMARMQAKNIYPTKVKARAVSAYVALKPLPADSSVIAGMKQHRMARKKRLYGGYLSKSSFRLNRFPLAWCLLSSVSFGPAYTMRSSINDCTRSGMTPTFRRTIAVMIRPILEGFELRRMTITPPASLTIRGQQSSSNHRGSTDILSMAPVATKFVLSALFYSGPSSKY